MDDEFTFPTLPVPPAPAPVSEEQKQDLDEAPLPGRLLGPTTSPLWPFSSSSPKTKSTTTTPDDDEDAPSTSTRIGVHAQAVRQHDDEDRMDLLWEDFNDDDLKLPQRRRPDSSDDTESEETSGCAPTAMLRASSRAGGAGQFCGGSSRSGRGGRTTGWALLLRLFHRLFAVDKRPPSRRRHHHPGIYAP